MVLRRSLLLMALVILASCEGAPHVPLVSVSDSSGVEIVLSHAPRWSADEAWTVAEEPDLSIGVVDGDPRYILDRVRSPFRMRDGRIVVPNTISRVLRIYSAEGEHLQDIGGPGEGPGELGDFSQAWQTRGDSIGVYDMATNSVNVWDAEGNFGRRTRIETPTYIYGFIAMLDDGTYVAGDGSFNMNQNRGELTRDSTYLLSYHPDGSLSDSIAPAAGFIRLNGPLPFTPRLRWAASGSSVFIAEGDNYEVRVHQRSPSKTRLIRWMGPERPRTADQLDDLEPALEAEFEGDRLIERRRALASASHGPVLPALSEIRADRLGYLWARLYDPTRDNLWVPSPDSMPPSLWWVFDPDGHWLGRTELPPALDVADIGSDWILGVERDELDVPRVVLYRLDRS